MAARAYLPRLVLRHQLQNGYASAGPDSKRYYTYGCVLLGKPKTCFRCGGQTMHGWTAVQGGRFYCDGCTDDSAIRQPSIDERG